MSFLLVFNQVLVLFVLIAVGFFVAKSGMLSQPALEQLTSFVMLVVSPCVIISSLQVNYTPTLAHGLLTSALVTAGVMSVSIVLTTLLFRKRPRDNSYRAALRFASAYSNCGFMGLPLLKAIIGNDGLFYGAVFIAVFNLFAWTHGVALYRKAGQAEGQGARMFLKGILNPNMVAVAIGIPLFLFSVHLPVQIFSPMSAIASLNTPLSMIVIGGVMSKIDLRYLFSDKYIWPGVLMRNLAIPLLFLLVMRVTGNMSHAWLACLIQIACPAAGNTVMFAELYGVDTAFPSKLMSVSTLLSIVTIPLVLLVAA